MFTAKQRVAIAKDVIAQVKSGKYKAQSGSYLRRLGDSTCSVCAVGASVVSSCLIFPELKMELPVYFHHFKNMMKIIFGRNQARQIECAFEGWIDLDHRYGGYDGYVQFRKHYPRAKVRLLKIMKNIVENKGRFVPSKTEMSPPIRKSKVAPMLKQTERLLSRYAILPVTI